MASLALSIALLIVVSVVLGGWAYRKDRRNRLEAEDS